MTVWKKTITALALMAATASANAELPVFDITINFDGGLTSSQQSVFSSAEAFWESLITNYAYDVTFPTGLTITASGEPIDGQSGILGQAGPSTGYSDSGILYASTGVMRFDTADLNYMETAGSLYNVIVHEMAHVIGYGTLWTYNGLYTDGTGQYTGSYALAEYQAEFDSSATYIPVEQDGGAGTADGHWDENWAGGSSELMTGYYDGSPYISNTTLAQFRDLGYEVDYASLTSTGPTTPPNPANVPVPFLSLAALSMLAMVGRKKKS